MTLHRSEHRTFIVNYRRIVILQQVACYAAPDLKNFQFQDLDGPECLVGVYDIVYLHVHSIEFNVERTSSGMLKIFKVVHERHEYVCGEVLFHPSHVKIFPYSPNYSFYTLRSDYRKKSERSFSKSKRIEFRLGYDGLHSDNLIEEMNDYGCLTIQVIEKRHGAAWISNDSFSSFSFARKERKYYSSLEEAETDEKMKRRDYGNSWICSKLGLDPLVAEYIYSYVSWKPKPVFWFEKGDVLIFHELDGNSLEPCTGYTVFRKRAEDDINI